MEVARCEVGAGADGIIVPSSAAPGGNGPVADAPGPRSGDHAKEPARAASDVWDCGECDAGTPVLLFIPVFTSACFCCWVHGTLRWKLFLIGQ